MTTTFRVTFTGWDTRRKRHVTRRFKVAAANEYEAIDRIAACHGLREKYVMRSFQFDGGSRKGER